MVDVPRLFLTTEDMPLILEMHMENLDLTFAKHIYYRFLFSFPLLFFFLIYNKYQAARATASMPGFFDPFVYGADCLRFVDGSVVESNPTGT